MPKGKGYGSMLSKPLKKKKAKKKAVKK